MKRKTAGRKTAKKRASMRAKPLLELWKRSPDGPLGVMPGWRAAAIEGVPLPEDFHAVIGFHAGECLLEHLTYLEHEPWSYWWRPLAYDGEHYDNGTVDSSFPRYFFYSDKSDLFNGWPPPPARIDEQGNDLSEPEGWNGNTLALTERQLFAVGVAMRDAMREGFYLALRRYAEDLKSVPEAAAICAALERGRKKGASTVHKKAAPKKIALRKRFRELRKSGFTKTDARRVLEQETGISFRQIERDTAGLS